MRWSREHRLGFAVVCILGAALGLFVGFIVLAISRRSGSGDAFTYWIARPSLYWPWPTFGAAIAGLTFYAVQILRAPPQSMDDKVDVRSSPDAYYALISKAVSQLPVNDVKARQNVYDRARIALSAHVSKGGVTREQVALEKAILKCERRAPREISNLGSPLHRPSTTALVISCFLPALWMYDVTCMSLYWVARIPKRVKPHFGVDASPREQFSPDRLRETGTHGMEAEARVSSEATVLSPRPLKTGNFIFDHWRGLYSLGVSYWVFGFVITIVEAFGVVVIQAAFVGDDGYQPILIFFEFVCTWLFLSVATLWQIVGVWRSATRASEARRVLRRTAPWAGVAKFMIVLGALRFLGTFGTSAVPQLVETYRIGFMGDPDVPPYFMRIMRNGTEVEITGGFKYGLTDDFKKLLKASPQITVVHLNSIGGRIGEAIKLNKVIRDAGLKTYVFNFCASACTVAFAGGRERWLYRSGILGFHSGTFPGVDEKDREAANSAQRSVMISSGYNAFFVNKALSVPSNDMWEPTISELQAANVITAVSNGTQFAASGFGRSVRKEDFAEALAKNIPILAPLKDRYPADFAIVADAYYKSYVDGGTEEDDNNIVRYFSYAAVRKYLKGADDQAIRDFGALMRDELTVLQARDPVQCAKFGSTSGADPDIQFSFSTPMMTRYQSVGARVIRTSVTRTAYNGDQLTEFFKRTIGAMVPNFTRQQISLLAVASPNAQQAPDYCIAIIGLYQQILKAPPAEAAAMLRSLMKPG